MWKMTQIKNINVAKSLGIHIEFFFFSIFLLNQFKILNNLQK